MIDSVEVQGRRSISETSAKRVIGFERARHTLSAALVSHQFPRTSPSPFNIWRASTIVSCKRCSWLNINLASKGSPVNVLTSTMSKL